MEPTPVIEVLDVVKTFGHVRALDHVSISILEREVVALVGDNGAGKSTLVNVLSGVFEPDEGQVRVRGEAVALASPAAAGARGIATVHQTLALVDTLDVARNIYLGNTPRRWSFLVDYPRMYADAERALANLRTNIPSLRTRVGALSGGQRQAVAIARALGQEADIFLLDEPTAALGVSQTAVVNEIVLDLKAGGKSVVVITHNMQHAFEIADRILVLRHGRCVGALQRDETSMEEVVGLMTGAIAARTAA
jgi:ABC-type sugar transport system ATPase subunit